MNVEELIQIINMCAKAITSLKDIFPIQRWTLYLFEVIEENLARDDFYDFLRYIRKSIDSKLAGLGF